MPVRTLFRYLTGDRQAILELAANPRAVWVGLLFVISAGFAREYDGEDLLHEPWHLVIPLAASLVTSFFLFVLTFGRLVWTDPNRPPFWTAYRSFLTLYWMTAPLAWLYAVPYERFLAPVEAVEANLWTLALVAVWRVVLMVRVVSVLMGFSVGIAAVLVLAFADAVTQAALALVPLPVVSFMGGVRLTPSERLIGGITCAIQFWGILLGPLLLALFLIRWFRAWPTWTPLDPALAREHSESKGLKNLAIASVAVWIFLLPFTQPEQIRRHRAERMLRSGQVAEALQEMSAHSPDDYPPHWDPPPRIGYREKNPPLKEVLRVIDDHPPAPWVEAIYREKDRNTQPLWREAEPTISEP